jgi:outer membrane lipoprotein LolB
VAGWLRRIALLIAPAALMAGCAVAPQAPAIRSIEAVDRFALSGRVAVKLDSKGYSARLRWLHEPRDDAVWLYSPVGSVLATLTVNGLGATLVTADREVHNSNDVQALTREVLGWDLPLEGLQHWVLGRPDPAAPVAEVVRDQRSRLVRLVQRDWTVEYSAYVDDGVLPAALTLRYGELRLRLVVDRWQIAGLPE